MAKSEIEILYRHIDGAHFFSCSDKRADGFCVASPDLEVAFNEVALQLNALFKFNHGRDCNFHPRVTFDKFKDTVDAQAAVAKLADPGIMSGTIQPWEHLGTQQ